MLKKHPQIPIKLTAIRVRQLQLFALAAEVGSISEAARRSHVTQPAATEMLQELERAFSLQLFTRGAKGIVLTPQGERVAVRAAAALRELQWAVLEAESAGTVREVLRIGFLLPSMFSNLPLALQGFVDAHPDVLVHLRQFNAPDSALALLEGEIDIAVTLNHPSFGDVEGREKMHVKLLAEERYQIFLSSKLVTAAGWSPTAVALRELSWILPPKESMTRGLFEEWFFLHGVTPPDSYMEINPPMLAIELLRTMPYAALLPATAPMREHFPHLVAVPGEAFSLPVRMIVASKETQVSRPAVSAFIDSVVQLCGQR